MSASIKAKLHRLCLQKIDQRILDADELIKSTQVIANESGKSSAGDKYETTREVLQQEINRYLNQQQEALKLRKALTAINPGQNTESVAHGSLVFTNAGIFYLATSLGNIAMDDIKYLVISAGSPIGQLLLGKRTGEAFTFNKHRFKIENII